MYHPGKYGAFIAASTNSSVSFWDTATHKKIGSPIHHPDKVFYMAISANDDLAIRGGKSHLAEAAQHPSLVLL